MYIEIFKNLLICILFSIIFSLTLFFIFVSLIYGIDSKSIYFITILLLLFLFYLCYKMNNFLFERY